MRLTIFACFMAPALLPAVAQADAGGRDDTIIVSALRAPVEADRAAARLTVIDDAAIVATQPLALTDILIRTPGISLSRNGGYGEATSLRIRGADASQSLMVLDGMRLSDPSATAGGYGFSNLSADNLERIEILRGPQSILWGSDAIGGVINATIRKPTKALEGRFAVEAGSHDTVHVRASLGGANTLADWRVSLARFVAMAWQVEPCPPLLWLNPVNALHVMRIIQEGIGNVLRHAHATIITVACAPEPRDGVHGILVSISDNGSGPARDYAGAPGRGIRNMAARAEALGGHHRFGAETAGGSRSDLWLPVAGAPADAGSVEANAPACKR